MRPGLGERARAETAMARGARWWAGLYGAKIGKAGRRGRGQRRCGGFIWAQAEKLSLLSWLQSKRRGGHARLLELRAEERGTASCLNFDGAVMMDEALRWWQLRRCKDDAASIG
ncbi:hypothetical protein M0R45_002036 [Rubus argutus]|uniref:Uncharacterized protein n=1 Tax=Rubus argutus TaxID=59490 RepID=A0AAW1VK60_RUBAR